MIFLSGDEDYLVSIRGGQANFFVMSAKRQKVPDSFPDQQHEQQAKLQTTLYFRKQLKGSHWF
jgi:hypothetical protein